VFIDQLEIVEDATGAPDTTTDDADVACTTFAAVCGKGTYVRSLARDIGRALGCYGHVTKLRRTAVGPFTIDDAVTIAELEEMAADGAQDDTLEPVESALSDLLHVPVSGSDASRLARGQAVILRGRDAPIVSGLGYATHKGKLLALVEMERGELRPTRVFNLDATTV
jgi:tRNA pseudouridine55 synthase